MKSLYVLLLGASVGFSALAADTKTIIEDVNAQIQVCKKLAVGCSQMIQVNGEGYKLGYDPYANKNLGISNKINSLIDEAKNNDVATVGPISVKGYVTEEKGFFPNPTVFFTVFKITAANLTVAAPKLDLRDCTLYAKVQRSELAVNAVLQALNITKEQVTYENVSEGKYSNDKSRYEDYSFLVGNKHRIVVQQYQDKQNQSSCALNTVTIDMGRSKSCSDENKIENSGLIAKGLLPFLKEVDSNINYIKKTMNVYASDETTYVERFLFNSGEQNIAVEYANIGESCTLSQVKISPKFP